MGTLSGSVSFLSWCAEGGARRKTPDVPGASHPLPLHGIPRALLTLTAFAAGQHPTPPPVQAVSLPADARYRKKLEAARDYISTRSRDDAVSGQRLVLERFEELPLLLFTAQVIRPSRENQPPVVTVASIDKATGKSLLLSKDRPANNYPFYAVQLDTAAGTIDLLCRTHKVRHAVRE